MTPDQIDELKEIVGDLKHLSEVAKQAPQPVRGVIETQLFLITAKIRYLLGED